MYTTVQMYGVGKMFSAFIWWKIHYSLNIICDGKAEFSVSLCQSSESHDPSEIIQICWFAAQETFTIIINVEYFDQFIVSLLNKMIYFLKLHRVTLLVYS